MRVGQLEGGFHPRRGREVVIHRHLIAGEALVDDVGQRLVGVGGDEVEGGLPVDVAGEHLRRPGRRRQTVPTGRAVPGEGEYPQQPGATRLGRPRVRADQDAAEVGDRTPGGDGEHGP